MILVYFVLVDVHFTAEALEHSLSNGGTWSHTVHAVHGTESWKELK